MTDHTFKEALKNPNAPIAIDLSFAGSSVLVAFGGIFGALGLPPFEFFNLTNELPVGKIYVRDLNQAWYQKGLHGIADDIDGLAMFLAGAIETTKPRNVVVVGNSMGGYAAIVFGLLLNANIVHAFSPQTFIDRRNRLLYEDRRWLSQIEQMHQTKRMRYLDIKELIESKDHSKCRINIYYSREDKLDSIHAERLRGLKNIQLHCFNEGGHSVIIKHLKAQGTLKKIILESLSTQST